MIHKDVYVWLFLTLERKYRKIKVFEVLQKSQNMAVYYGFSIIVMV
ncbi:hypothetical protein [Christiangramia sabulilitoris]|nr:hypothetical protein [Christiangramia sabulilitoris]